MAIYFSSGKPAPHVPNDNLSTVKLPAPNPGDPKPPTPNPTRPNPIRRSSRTPEIEKPIVPVKEARYKKRAYKMPEPLDAAKLNADVEKPWAGVTVPVSDTVLRVARRSRRKRATALPSPRRWAARAMAGRA